ncbi:unnamed protein product [Leptosia nina]|uniref:Uncharacterized protein n=1 Tax=Leptosia nina TaxID=320188 RepID=A0AAV1K4K0_9NEOP
MTLEAFELLIGKVVQTDSSGTILEPLAPATAAAKLCFTGLLFFLFQEINRLRAGRGGVGAACARIPASVSSFGGHTLPPHSPRTAPRLPPVSEISPAPTVRTAGKTFAVRRKPCAVSVNP